jgi:hypothetical protein
MNTNSTAAAFIDDAARRKNGLNLQIFVAGVIVCLSSFPLIAAFMFPILTAPAIILFLVGFAMAYGGWPVLQAGLESRRALIEELKARRIRYDDVQDASWTHVPEFARGWLGQTA